MPLFALTLTLFGWTPLTVTTAANIVALLLVAKVGLYRLGTHLQRTASDELSQPVPPFHLTYAHSALAPGQLRPSAGRETPSSGLFPE